MKVTPLELEGAYYLEPNIFKDDRGYFLEWFNARTFTKETGVKFNIVQSNYSKSTKGVLRGLHYQLNPFAQAKLVAVVKGKIQDVIVDIRKNSPTYGQFLSFELSADKKNQLFVPKGFAHGFLVLSEEAEIFYAIDEFYSPEHESGIKYNTPELAIPWAMPDEQISLSEKDAVSSDLSNAKNNFNE